MSYDTAVNQDLSTSWGQTPEVDGTAEPACWDSAASRMVVYRAGLTDSKGRERLRMPLFSHADKITGNTQDARVARGWSEIWWSGVGFELDEARRITSGDLNDYDRQLLRAGAFGRWPGHGKDLAHLPALDDQFVIDCDVKRYYDSPDGQAWIHHPDAVGSGQWTAAESYTRFGLDDLYREAEEWGMVREELDDHLDTWTETTKSGGCHIVLKQNDEVRIERTMHHRDNYRVDVIASENNWRACFPTPGYRVLKDRPVKMAHRRLAELLIELNRSLLPVGGKRAERIKMTADLLTRQTYTRAGTVRPEAIKDGSLMDRWRLGVLHVVAEANQSGGWNNKIFWAACRFAEGGWAQSDAERNLLAAAQPWSAREEREALDTINSAYNNVAQNKGVGR